MLEPHRLLIKSIIDLNPESINMHWGYKGDYIVKITTLSLDTTIKIEDIAKSLGLIVKIIHDTNSTKLYNIHCVAVDDDVYELK